MSAIHGVKACIIIRSVMSRDWRWVLLWGLVDMADGKHDHPSPRAIALIGAAMKWPIASRPLGTLGSAFSRLFVGYPRHCDERVQ